MLTEIVKDATKIAKVVLEECAHFVVKEELDCLPVIYACQDVLELTVHYAIANAKLVTKMDV